MNADEQREIHRFLSAGGWFRKLSAALQQLILSRSVVRKFAKGQVISVEDSVPKGLYAVLEGQVHLVRDVGTGDEALLHIGEPGYWFGEFGALTGRPTVVTAIARAPVRTLFLPKMQLDRILAEDPRHYQAFAGLVFDRYAALLRVFVELRGLTPEERLRGRLATMARLRKQDRSDAAPASLAVSQADLARMVGVSRQTLNALLGKLDQEGLIEVGFRRIRVLDVARLADPHAAAGPETGERASMRRRATRLHPRVSSERID
jgi:CRP-like cAMP-binding protein